jgi:hypothetical protein
MKADALFTAARSAAVRRPRQSRQIALKSTLCSALGGADPLDNQDALLVLDVSERLDLVALRIDLDLTRLQRAGERAGQSPAGRGYSDDF